MARPFPQTLDCRYKDYTNQFLYVAWSPKNEQPGLSDWIMIGTVPCMYHIQFALVSKSDHQDVASASSSKQSELDVDPVLCSDNGFQA